MKLHWQTRHTLRLWAPAVIGIAVMVLGAIWGSPWIRFVLFGHHVFYFVAAGLLFNPVVQTFSRTFLGSSEAKLERQVAAELDRKAWQQTRQRRGATSRTPGVAAPGAARLRGEKVEAGTSRIDA